MNKVLSPAVPEVIRLGQLEIRYLQEAGDGCRMGAFEMRVPPGSNVPPPHSHSANEELVYARRDAALYRGSETRDLKPGDSMATPCGVVHAFSNPHAVVARALVINTPDIGRSTSGSESHHRCGGRRTGSDDGDDAEVRVVGRTSGSATALTAADRCFGRLQSIAPVRSPDRTTAYKPGLVQSVSGFP
jgi:uncharacterized cupin superfamily protein